MHIPNDTYVYLLMHLCIYLLWRKYNRITSVGIGIESIPVSSIIAKAKWAQLAWQQRSALGEATRLARQWLGRRRKTPPPALSKILNNSKTASRNAVVFDMGTFSGINLIPSVKIWRWSVRFFFICIDFYDVTTRRFRSKSAKCLEIN